jgi:hypothetical protein
VSDGDVTVVWLAETEASDEAERALEEWGRARSVRLRPAQESRRAGAIGLDRTMTEDLADRVDKELERAHEAIAALDADPAERALARAEALLREHAELPQAAWLRAEVERAWAARWMRVLPRDESRAAAAWQAAAALDGGRRAGVGETPFPPLEPVAVTIAVRGVRGRRIEVRLNGALVEMTPRGEGAEARVEIPPGEQHLVAYAAGQTVFASWVTMVAEEQRVELPLPARDACAAESFRAVRRENGGVLAPGIVCDRWVFAVPLPRPGAILVARCTRETCGPLLEWRTERFIASPPLGVPPASGWPTWATWTLVGFGAATATTMALIATGVFESRPTEPRFIAGGVRVE